MSKVWYYEGIAVDESTLALVRIAKALNMNSTVTTCLGGPRIFNGPSATGQAALIFGFNIACPST